MSIAKLGCLFLLIHTLSAACAHAADRIRIAAQKTGTLAWELAVVKAHGLDRKAGIDLVITELAAPEAGKIALKGGAADVIVTDFLWVARERALGGQLVFAPYGATLGAVMVPASGTRKTIKDLAGAKIGVAGGPIDKSWLMLVALGLGNDIDLRRKATPAYGAPPLLSEKLMQGELDAVLTFWNFSAQLEARGFRRMIEMADVQARLGAKGKVAILGFAFDSQWAERNRGAIDRFLATSQEAKQILASTPAEWKKLAPRIGTTDPAALDLYRRRYAEGVPRRPLADEIADARALYKVMASIGGKDLVGPALELDPASYWRPARLP
jgi:NitT/TauT family transport system substrate-binding protein